MRQREAPRRLTPAHINQIAFAIRDKKGAPDDARALLALFCQAVESRRILPRDPVANRLLEHVRGALRAALDGRGRDSSVDRALGLIRRRGNQHQVPEGELILMAAEVLRHRLAGKPHQSALDKAEKRGGWAQGLISKAWRMYPQTALMVVQAERGSAGFSEEERERLRRIFKNRPGFESLHQICD
jgi:hypothetical protein